MKSSRIRSFLVWICCRAWIPSAPANAMRISNPPKPTISTSLLFTVGIKPARCSHAGFRAEPGGEHRERGETKADAASGNQIVGFRSDAAGNENADDELEDDVNQDADEHRVHCA